MNKKIEPNGKFIGPADNVVPIKSNADLSTVEAARRYIAQVGSDNVITNEHAEIYLYADDVWSKPAELAIQKELTEIFESLETTPTLSKIKGAVAFVKSETFRSQEFNPPCETIGVKNGELSLVDGEWTLIDHKRENYRTSLLPIEFDKSASCPRFLAFLDEIFPEANTDAESKKKLIIQGFGYALTNDCRYEKFFMLKGSGANGKSVLLLLLENLLSCANVASVDPTQFSNKFQVAYLQGKFANIVTEFRENLEIDDGALKRITSGEPITAEHKYGNPFTYRSFAKCFFGTNHLPRTKDVTPAFFRRAIIIEFNRTFKSQSESDFDASKHGVMDVNLKHELLAELPGILNLALKGLAALRRNRQFTDCESSNRLIAEWNRNSDYVLQFVEEKLERSDGCRLAASDVYKTYVEWCEASGVRQPLTSNNFGRRLTELHFERIKSRGLFSFLNVRFSYSSD